MTLVDWVRLVGAVVGVLGAYWVSPAALSAAREHLMRLLGRRPPQVRIAGIKAFSPPDPGQVITYALFEDYLSYHLFVLGLTPASRKADQEQRSRDAEQAAFNRRAFFPIAAGIALPGLPDPIVSPAAVSWTLIAVGALTALVGIPDGAAIRVGRWMREHHLPWASKV